MSDTGLITEMTHNAGNTKYTKKRNADLQREKKGKKEYQPCREELGGADKSIQLVSNE